MSATAPNAAKKPSDERLVFDHVVDALLRAVGAALTPAVEARLHASGLVMGSRRLPAYPLETWREFLQIGREALFPNVPEKEGMERLGARFVDGYFESMLGGAVERILRILGPRRALMRATQTFRSGNNFTQSRVTQLPDGSQELWMNGCDNLDFTAGIIHRALEKSGAQGTSVAYRSDGEDSCTFTVRWT